MRSKWGQPKRTREDKRTAATLWLHQHPRPETVTPEQLMRATGCDEEWAKYQCARVGGAG